MVLMALDHSRDYFGDMRQVPTDLDNASVALFLTRWVTHFCAPVFVLLAGLSAWLWRERRGSSQGLSRYLVTRGLWLILLEVTVVNASWMFSLRLGIFVQVIAAIGVGLVVLGGLVHLSERTVAAVGFGLAFGHPLLEPVAQHLDGTWAQLWSVVYGPGAAIFPPRGPAWFVIYSLLPWVGLLALGYGLGPLMRRPPRARHAAWLRLGLATLAAFLLLRALGWGGDPNPWRAEGGPLRSLLAFLNCTKYPPSPVFLAMTLGPALVLLGTYPRWGPRMGRAADVLATYGRVPLFYYLLHLPLIHLLALAGYGVVHGEFLSPMQAVMQGRFPPWFGGNLWVVYLGWMTVVLLLYPLCARFGELRARGRWPLLRWL